MKPKVLWMHEQGILKGEVSLYHWPPVWLVWNQLYGCWQFLFLFAKQTNPNQSNMRSTVQWYFPLLVFPGKRFLNHWHMSHNLVLLDSYWCATWRIIFKSQCPVDSWSPLSLLPTLKLKTQLFFTKSLFIFSVSNQLQQPQQCKLNCENQTIIDIFKTYTFIGVNMIKIFRTFVCREIWNMTPYYCAVLLKLTKLYLQLQSFVMKNIHESDSVWLLGLAS